MKTREKQLDNKNYRKLLQTYYLDLKCRVAQKQTSEIELKRWDRVLLATLKFPSPKKETEFVLSALVMERQNLRRAA